MPEIAKNKRATTIHHGVICAVYALLFYTGAILDKKIDHIFIFTIPGAAWFFIFIYPLSDAVTEVYGPRKAWANLIAGYLICSVFIAVTAVTIHFPSAHLAGYQRTNHVYLTLQDAIVKCFSLGYLVFFVGMFINVKLLGKWKLQYNGRHYYWRSYVASAVSEGFVVIFANAFIWYNRVSLPQLFTIIITTYALKLILTFAWAFVGLIVRNVLYVIEGARQIYTFNSTLYKRLDEE
jgi:uncharacterized PurR-regulated membrane protein YhhQ (DUF165 family)